MCDDISRTLNAGDMGRIDTDTETFVAHSLRASGFDASEDGTCRRTPIIAQVSATLPAAGNETGGNRQPGTSAETAATLLVAYRTTGNKGCYETGDIINALNTATDPNQHVLAIQGAATRENPTSGPDGIGVRTDGAAYTPEARQEVQAVAYDMRGREGGAQFEGPHHTANIRAANGGSSRSYLAFAQNTRDEVRLIGGDGQSVGALAADAGMKQTNDIATQWAVRRLTPLECTRMQGFPDDYFDVPGKPFADGSKYKMLGNSMAVNVMSWIGHRIAAVDAIPAAEVAA